MSGNTEKRLSKEELDWIQLRNELDEIRGREIRARKSSFSMDTWYIPFGLAVTFVSFCYGLHHMHHPTKSIIGAYSRIFSQGITASAAVYVYMKFNAEGKANKVNMEYSD